MLSRAFYIYCSPDQLHMKFSENTNNKERVLLTFLCFNSLLILCHSGIYIALMNILPIFVRL